MTPDHKTRPLGAAFAALGLVVLATGMSAEDAKAQAMQTRYSQSTSESHPYFAGAKKFKEVLEAETDGRITVDLYASATVADEGASLQLLRSGALEFAQHSSSLAASTFNVPHLMAWTMPFLYPDAEATYRAWDSELFTESFGVFDRFGFKCLVLWDAGSRQLSSNRAVEKVADVSGLKIRTPNSPVYIDIWNALGGVPAPMAFAELYTGLQTGVVDGTELPVQLIFSDKFHEVQSHQAIINYMNDPICFSVSKVFYDRLTPDLQAAVVKAAMESAVAQRATVQEGFQAAIDGIAEQGMTVTYPDTSEFREAVLPVYESFYSQAGDEGRALVESILAIVSQ